VCRRYSKKKLACTDHIPEFGILWPMDWAVPVAARCASDARLLPE